MQIAIIESPGYEADDALATLAVQALEHDGDALVCSVDKDVLQVVRPGITVWREHLGKSEELDSAAVFAKLGVNPPHVADYLALVGDTADRFAIAPEEAHGRLIYFTDQAVPGYPPLGSRIAEPARFPALPAA